MRGAAIAAGLVAVLSLGFVLAIELLPVQSDDGEGTPEEIYDLLALTFWGAILVLLFIGVLAVIRGGD